MALRDFLRSFSDQPDSVNPGEVWTSCSDLRPGHVVPDIGTLTAVSEPGRDGEMHVQTDDGRTHSLSWGGIVRRRA